MKNFLKRVKKKIYRKYGRFSIARHGFWFVDIPRTSSSSISSELGKRFGRTYGKRRLEKEHASPQIFPDHVPAREMQAFLGDSIWNSIFTFTIVRDPWDRTFSMYHYRQKIRDIPKEWSFRDYVLALGKATSRTEFFKPHVYRYGASEYILGENGKIIVDYIIKYENRSHGIKTVCSRLNLGEFGGLHILSAKPANKHYSESYDSETREVIRRLYARDIELFDYKFVDKT